MIDSGELGSEWYRSVIYSDDWFGSVDNTEEDGYMIMTGRFAKVCKLSPWGCGFKPTYLPMYPPTSRNT